MGAGPGTGLIAGVKATAAADAFDVEIWGQCEREALYPTSYVPTYGLGPVTRSADSLYFASLTQPTTGGLLAMIQLPYAGTVPTANQYHIGLNGSDSLNNGAFLYTKAADDHLYAELRSGGAQQAEIDLGAYAADTLYAVAMDWDATGLRACINGTEKTASGAVTVPAALDRIQVGKGISSHTQDGGQTRLILTSDRVWTAAERAELTGSALRTAVSA
jgi:hypothetical protein